MEQNLYLAHHGVKGMRWGVRRTPEQLGYHVSSSVKTVGNAVSKVNPLTNGSKPKHNLSYEERRKLALTTRSPKVLRNHMETLTDTELQKRYNRLNLENNVRKLANPQVKNGQKITLRELSHGVGKDLAREYLKKGVKYGLRVAGLAVVAKYGKVLLPGKASMLTEAAQAIL